MSGVKVDRAQEPDHLAYLLYMATRRLRAEGEAAVTRPVHLQAAQARLLDLVPDGGGRVADVARRMGVTKQNLGQLAQQLTSSGHLETTTDPDDRRAKVLRRTALGERERRLRRDVTNQVEEQWRAEVGAADYAVFRRVLAAVALRAGDDAPSGT